MNTNLRDYPFEPDNDWGFFIDLDYDDYEPAYYECAYYETTYYENINSDSSSSSSDSIYYESTLYENIETDTSVTIHYEKIHTDADTCELFNEIKQLFKYVTTTICISGVIIYNYFITNKVSVACC